MVLNAADKQMAMDYVIYMMAGSYFKKARAASASKEGIFRLRYLLLGRSTQYELEAECEGFFLRKILGKLPEDFLAEEVSVNWVRSKDAKHTAVVFANGARQLWISADYGRRNKWPVFKYRVYGLEPEKEAAEEAASEEDGKEAGTAVAVSESDETEAETASAGKEQEYESRAAA